MREPQEQKEGATALSWGNYLRQQKTHEEKVGARPHSAERLSPLKAPGEVGRRNQATKKEGGGDRRGRTEKKGNVG